MKGPAEKNFEGIYANPRLMHAVGMVVGCIAHVQVKSGAVFEGVLKTISSKADVVLEMARKLDGKPSANCIPAFSATEEMVDKLVFRFEDVVSISALNVDPEYATRESFTDTGISKFNGQVLERELEPWDGGALSADGLTDLGASEEANGWDPNDMFRTNEEKYGVKSSFDSTLPGYTIPLNKQNTEEYKQQEARASKIAQEIESGFHHKNRAALENGDEEERFSAVVRPENNNNFRYVSHKPRRPSNVRNIRNPPPHMNRNNPHQHSQVFHRVSSPASALNNNNNNNPPGSNYKMVNSVSNMSNANAISPRPTPTSTPPTSRPPMAQMPQHQTPPSAQYPANQVNAPVGVSQPTVRTSPPTPVIATQDDNQNHTMNGGRFQKADKMELKFAPKPPRSLNLQSAANKEMRDSVANQQVNKNAERRKETEKKTPIQKARDDKTEDLKRFHASFKLSEDPKNGRDKDNSPKPEMQSSNAVTPMPPNKHHNKDKGNKEDERKGSNTPDSRTSPDNPKNSTLNPNAKEFVFNPNAKSFTPRGAPVQQAPPSQPPPRLHTQSPIMAMPQAHLLPGMTQPVFNVPHYVMSAAPPVSMPMAQQFTPSASVAQAPRFRKAVPVTLQRHHDLSQPVHVQAATGPPILAQPGGLSAPFALYPTTPPGMLHHPPGPPQQLTYTPMYSFMPRVITPQQVGMVPTSAAYGESPQMPTHVYMHHGTPSLQHAMATSNNGQHSAPSTPQSQTPNLHPAPSPVHQAPPSGAHGQPPTPTGHPGNAPTPQPIMYTTHGHMTTQHPLHGNHSATNQGHPFAASYPGGPQPIVLLSQQPHGQHPGSFATTLQSHLHGQNPGNHVGTPTHILQHGPLMIPTSAGMVHTQTAITSGHYVPHSQGRVMSR
ncbi:hypothetical protein JTE90_013172 [Oedothorax gibbosus]|uniref:LsmAD domain-containing protein n=1 Tax=Oedothorax gibbosus TaxID=931172 RepID=A0AAV6UAM5_9ARAC|nr:hypothetical protein JTE90_013172 [Oedothorax gibbosus]